MPPTLFVDMQSKFDRGTSPLQAVIPHVSFGAVLAEKLVDENDVEASIAVTADLRKALDFVKQTEKTIVVILPLEKHDQRGAESLAQSYPGRVRIFRVVDFVVSMLKLIGEVEAGEVSHANPAP